MGVVLSTAVSSLGHEHVDVAYVASLAPSLFVWDVIHREAGALLLREPVMAAAMGPVLASSSPPGLLAGVLSSRLWNCPMPRAELAGLLQGVLDHESSILQQAAADLAAVKARDPACAGYLHTLLNLKGFHALQVYRVCHALWLQRRHELAHWLSNLAATAFAVDIHPAACIGSGVMLDHATGIVIGETAVVEDDVSILQDVTLGGTGKEHGDRHPKIRRGVLLGAGAKVLGNIEVGTMSKVAAGSVVLRSVPPHCTVAGVPAKVVRLHAHANCPADEMDQGI